MKVLWVCNIMLPAIAKRLNLPCSNREGWLSGLLDRVVMEQERNRIELGIAFPVDESLGNFDRMMRFECALYGLRTLLFGLPLSLLVSWLIYFGLTFKETEAFPFQFPWASLGISMVGVFIVIFITMLYATSKIRKENIIDSLRDEMT